MRGLAVGRMPQSAAADRWLSTAPGPAESTAAIHLPSRVRTVCPTAYTPSIGRSWPGNPRVWRSDRYDSASRASPMIVAVVVAPATKPKHGPKSRVDGKPGM